MFRVMIRWIIVTSEDFKTCNKSIPKVKEMNRMVKAATLVAKCKPASNKLGLEDVSKVVRTAETSWACIYNSFNYSNWIKTHNLHNLKNEVSVQ